jgi:hypothetical protein
MLVFENKTQIAAAEIINMGLKIIDKFRRNIFFGNSIGSLSRFAAEAH